MVCGDESLGSEPQSQYTTARAIYFGGQERIQGHALQMTANAKNDFIRSTHFLSSCITWLNSS